MHISKICNTICNTKRKKPRKFGAFRLRTTGLEPDTWQIHKTLDFTGIAVFPSIFKGFLVFIFGNIFPFSGIFYRFRERYATRNATRKYPRGFPICGYSSSSPGYTAHPLYLTDPYLPLPIAALFAPDSPERTLLNSRLSGSHPNNSRQFSRSQ